MFLAYIVLFHAQRDLAVVSEIKINQGLKLKTTKNTTCIYKTIKLN